MILTKCLLGAVLLASMSIASMAATKGPSLQDRQQAACYNDAQKLCPDAIPNVEKVTACMADKRAQVSPACAAMYDVKE